MEKGDWFVVLAGVLFFCAAVWLLAGGWDYISGRLFAEKVYVDTEYEELVIDKPLNVHLIVAGNGNDVVVTRETLLMELEFLGNENIVELCDGVHDPEIINDGEENEVVFVVC